MKNTFWVREIIYLTTHFGHLQRVQKSWILGFSCFPFCFFIFFFIFNLSKKQHKSKNISNYPWDKQYVSYWLFGWSKFRRVQSDSLIVTSDFSDFIRNSKDARSVSFMRSLTHSLRLSPLGLYPYKREFFKLAKLSGSYRQR